MPRWDGSTFQAHARTRRFTDTFGFWCEVSLSLGSLDSEERRLEGVEFPRCFHGAVVFGIDYALGKLGYFGGWVAKLDRFEQHAVDTTAEVVALTVAQAVLSALGHEEQPVLDAELGIVSFPK